MTRADLETPDPGGGRDARITTLIATSPIPSMPSIVHVKRTLDSLARVPELAVSPILIICDGVRKQAQKDLYKRYIENIRDYLRQWPNVELIELTAWGHFSGVVKAGITLVRTPFVFVQQHDLPLVRSFDLNEVLRCMERDERVKYVRLNGRRNRPRGWDKNVLFGPYDNPHVPLIRTACWSDPAHIAPVAYYRDVVLPLVGDRKIFIESLLHGLYNVPEGSELLEVHRKLGTFVYGRVGDPPVVEHTEARYRMA